VDKRGDVDVDLDVDVDVDFRGGPVKIIQGLGLHSNVQVWEYTFNLIKLLGGG
jgi:hypothetical protein